MPDLLLTETVGYAATDRLGEARALLRRSPTPRASVTPLVLAAVFAAVAALAAAVTMILGAPVDDHGGSSAPLDVRTKISAVRAN